MKENNRNQKYTRKKNIVLSKKEIKIVNHIFDFKKTNKSSFPNNSKKNSNKKISPKHLEPIKVRLTPINKRNNSKRKKNNIDKDLNNTSTHSNKYNNSLYLSPNHISNITKNGITQTNLEQKITYTESRNKEKLKNTYSNCTTPYRRIISNKHKEDSPSTSVIIKNFNYNNVYNINIDDKNYNKTITKKDNNDIYFDNNDNDNESLSKFSFGENKSKKFTYNRPKTSSAMNIHCSLSKRNKSKDTSLITEDINNRNNEKNNTITKNDTILSRFITEGNTIKNGRNYVNLPIAGLISREAKISDKNKNICNLTPNKIKSNNKLNMSSNKSYIKDYNNAVKTINNNYTYSKNFNKNNNSYSNIKRYKTGKNNFYNTSNISGYFNRNVKHSLKINKKYINKTQNYKNKINKNNFSKKNDNNNNDNENKNLSFNLNDLFIFEDRINDIVSAFNKINNIYDIEASNECNEFINFYSKSSLQNIFPTFFKENNKLIIVSSVNLSLFFLSIVYHLSINNLLFNDLIPTINNILSYLKINFALYIKNIQLYYGINIIKKNYLYFQPFNNFLNNQNIIDIEGEDDITYKIYQNCRFMTSEIKIIMNYYQKIDINYYDYFIKIFNNISIQKESDLIDYFFDSAEIKSNSPHGIITVNKSYKNISNDNLNLNNTPDKLKINKSNLGHFSPYRKEKLSFKTPDKIYLKSPMRTTKNESKNKIEIPYIKNASDKKYTLVLDLNKTLAFFDNDKISLRTGLFSFLSMIKPYYELIAFSCDTNDINNKIIKEIESQNIFFDYKFAREHSILYENTLVKDLTLIGRDISKIIIVDDDENCFKLNKENGIKIAAYTGNNINDTILFELKKILILIYKNNYDDIRIALKDFSNDIKNKISSD